MTRPMSEPNNWQTLSHYGWRMRQLERRPGGGVKLYHIKLCSDYSRITSSFPKPFFFTVPADVEGTRLVAAHAGVSTASGTGPVQVGVGLQDKSDGYAFYYVFGSSFITIDEDDYDSFDSATQPVIDVDIPALGRGDFIQIWVESPGDGAYGLDVSLTFA